MYNEVLKQSKKTILGNMFFILGIIISLWLVMSILYLLFEYWKVPLLNYMYLVLLLMVAWYIIIKYIVEYRYTLIGHDLIIQKFIGNTGRQMVSIDIKNIIDITPYKNRVIKDNHILTNIMTQSPSSKNAYSIIFEKDGKRCRVIFQPTEHLLQLINKEKMKNKGR